MRNLSVFQRLSLIVAILSIAFLALAAAQVLVLRRAVIEERKSKLVDMVGSVELMVKRFDEKAKAGEMSLEAAQAAAAQAIIGMRWGDGDYFGVYRYDGLTLAHGNPKNIGQMRLGFKDPTGRLLVSDMIDVSKKNGHGWVDYVQTRAGKDEPLTKLAYVGGYEPWQWSIQAGAYTDDIDVVVRRNATWTAGAGLAGLLVAGLLAFWVGRGITHPLAAICAAMDRLASGHLDADVPFAERKNEIGRIARSLVVFKTSLIEAERMRAEQDEMKGRAAAERTAAMERMADGFEHSVGGIVGAVAAAAGAMRSAAESMSGTAADTTRRSEAVATAAHEATTNVQSVASSTEELTSSIHEIAQRVAQSATIAQSAVDQAGRTNATVESLAQAAQKIGEVVGLIQAIAGQTNLLALNATIEAARAGDAGRGFAVVASEVKTLATETAKATEEIAAQIQAIQGATGETVGAIREIGATIGQINEIAASIASAVEQQGAATQEISKNVQSAAQGTQEVTGNIAGVTRASGEVTEAASQVLGAANDLALRSDQLKQEVQSFLATVRAA